MLDWCYSKGRGRCRDEWFSRLWTVGTVHFYYDKNKTLDCCKYNGKTEHAVPGGENIPPVVRKKDKRKQILASTILVILLIAAFMFGRILLFTIPNLMDEKEKNDSEKSAAVVEKEEDSEQNQQEDDDKNYGSVEGGRSTKAG